MNQEIEIEKDTISLSEWERRKQEYYDKWNQLKADHKGKYFCPHKYVRYTGPPTMITALVQYHYGTVEEKYEPISFAEQCVVCGKIKTWFIPPSNHAGDGT